MNKEGVSARFIAARPAIRDILSAAGTVGLTYGVIHHGQIIHSDSFGFRDHESKLPMNEKTMMPICSMTKGLVTCALGSLVEDGKLRWDTPVSCLLPDYAPHSKVLAERATVVDFLAMRSGIERYNGWTQSDNRMTFVKEDGLKIMNSFTCVSDLRADFAYNNWGYEIASQILDKVGGRSWDAQLHDKFFTRLGLTRTDATGARDGFDNVACAYMVLDDRTPVQIPVIQMSGTTLLGAAGGVVSCISDLLRLYSEMLKAAIDQFDNNATATPNSVFKQLLMAMSAQTQLATPSYRESTYGLGWMRTQTPNVLCKIGTNIGLLGKAPVIGKGSESRLIVGHYGSMPRNFSGVLLFPETESAIIVLTNTTPLCDMADYMAQFLTQILFDLPEKVDILSWVQKTAAAELKWHANLAAKLKCQDDGTVTRDIQQYIGKYYNASQTLLIEIKKDSGDLVLSFEGRDDELWPLAPCRGDTFSWLQPRNKLVSRGRVVLQPAPYYEIRFARDQGGAVDSLFWCQDSRIPGGERYTRREV